MYRVDYRASRKDLALYSTLSSGRGKGVVLSVVWNGCWVLNVGGWGTYETEDKRKARGLEMDRGCD